MKGTFMEEIAKLKELNEQINALNEQVKEVRKTIEAKVMEAEGLKLLGEWGEAKMVYVPRWKYSEELTIKEKMTAERFKLAKKEEQVTGKAEKITDGGRLTITLK